MMIDKEFKKFMEDIWTVNEIDGVKVVDRIVGFGALPDIKFWLENETWVSAKKLWQERERV